MSSLPSTVATQRLRCQHFDSEYGTLDAISGSRNYSVHLAGNFATLVLCHDCDPIFNAGGQIILDSGRRVKLPERITPTIVEIDAAEQLGQHTSSGLGPHPDYPFDAQN